MGAAGDMLTAALLELMPDKAAALAELNAIGIPDVVYGCESVLRCGIRGTHMSVKIHGVEESETMHDHHHDHDHDHAHHHDHAHGHHHHTGLHGIAHIVEDHLNLPEAVKKDVLAVYSMIAEAESHAHGVPVTEIHFHEVGTMDALADISAVSLLLHKLAPQQIIASPVCVGAADRCGAPAASCRCPTLPRPACCKASPLTAAPYRQSCAPLPARRF